MQVFALNKADYDIIPKLAKNSATNNQINSYASAELELAFSEMSMISGGYFTLGTSNDGFSRSPFDNKQTLTFGHPYAMTSYPLLSIDQSQGRMDELYPTTSDLYPSKTDSSLFINFINESNIEIIFEMVSHNDGITTQFNLTYINHDTESHELGGGLVIDPALSRYGDGYIEDKTNELGSITGQFFEISEHNGTIRGMRMGLRLDDPNATVITGNWERIFENPYAEIYEHVLYDAALEILWQDKTLASGDTLTQTAYLELLSPEFGTSVFLRWDCPNHFILSDNVMYPQDFTSTVEMMSTNQYFTAPNINILLDNPYEIYGSNESYQTTLTSERSFMSLPLHTREIYEEKIVKIRLIVNEGGTVLDSLSRYVKIPATPVSDTGLEVTIDSLITQNYPDLQMVFSGQIEETGQKLLNLRPENVFLYENDQRIEQISLLKDTTGGVNAADIIFVLDVTGSMGDEIAGVKNNIIEFADSLSERGIDYQLGMVTFLDVIENTYPFTSDINQFKSWINEQYSHGGGDSPENSLDALMNASQFSFRNDSKRMIIWITDERYHESDNVTSLDRNQVINNLLLNNITVHAIASTGYKSSSYDPIVNATGGNFYDIRGNFRDILLDVSRMRAQHKYLISFKSKYPTAPSTQLRLKIHYAGLGGEATTEYYLPDYVSESETIACYPNPFNPEITLDIQLQNSKDARVDIYNVLGQRIRHFDLSNQTANRLIWNATNEQGIPVSGGMYIVRLSHRQNNGELKNEIRKILYLK